MRLIVPCLLALALLPGCAALEQKIGQVSEKIGTGTAKASAKIDEGVSKASAHMDEKTAKVSEAAKQLDKEEASPEQEIVIGRESASMLLGAAPLVRNAELTRYINSLGGWVALQTGRGDINWRFGILDSPNVNAFAAPDGFILVTRGLMLKLNDEAELAGVVAHEMAHVIRRHYIIAMRKKDESDAIGKLTAATVEVVGIPGKATTPVFNLAQNIYSSGLDKTDEYEADRLGVVYATRAGYDPYGLLRVISMYAANAGGEGFELLISTHPSPHDRLAELNRIMDRLARYEKSGASGSPQFEKMMALLHSQPGRPAAAATATAEPAPEVKADSAGKASKPKARTKAKPAKATPPQAAEPTEK